MKAISSKCRKLAWTIVHWSFGQFQTPGHSYVLYWLHLISLKCIIHLMNKKEIHVFFLHYIEINNMKAWIHPSLYKWLLTIGSHKWWWHFKASVATRSQSNRPSLGCGRTGDWMMNVQPANLKQLRAKYGPASLRNVSSNCWIYTIKNWSSSEGERQSNPGLPSCN